MTSEPLLMVPAHRGICSKLLSSSSCSTEVWGCTSPPLLLITLQVPTSRLLATEFLKTSTPRVSAMISSVSLSRSGWTRATQSLQLMQLPRAESFSSTLTTLQASGREFRMCLSSLSVVLLGTRRPFLLPAVVLPTMRVPPMVAWMTGMKEPSSLSKTEQKLQEPPAAMRQQPLVSLAKTPMSFEFQYCTLFAMNQLQPLLLPLPNKRINNRTLPDHYGDRQAWEYDVRVRDKANKANKANKGTWERWETRQTQSCR